MKRIQRSWFLRAGAVLLAACSDSTAPQAVKLGFVSAPSNVTAGAPISPAIGVAIQDSSGKTVTSATGAVTVALGANPGSAALAGPTTVNAVNGMATFSALKIDKIGTGYTLTATAPGLVGATSAGFDVSVGPAAQLAFTVQPTSTNQGATIAPAIQVTAQDAGGNTTMAFTGSVMIAIGKNTGGAMLTGTASVTAVNGVATFSSLSLDQAGTGYTLVATATGLVAATSAAFDVAFVPPALHITTTTTGAAVPNGYSLCVDAYSSSYPSSGCAWSGSIGLNSALTVPVTRGGHSVELDFIPRNCALTGDTANPRSVTASGTTEVPFSVSCLDTGSVHVVITSTGTDLDPNGYFLCIDRSVDTCYWSARVHANDAIVISGVTLEPHTISIGDVAGNCTVSGGTTQPVTVIPHGTTDVSFTIGCVLAERIAFSSGGTITIMRVDGAGTPVSVASGFSPAWSADGTRLAYQCVQDVCAINPDGSAFAQLTTDAAANSHPTWSPDGAQIAFASARSGVPELWVMAANGSGAARLTQNIGFVGSPAWSPDGTKIAFDCRVDPANDDICVVNVDGTGFTRLTNDPARDYGAAWKRDGSTLAFATTRYGADEIVLMSSTGSSVTRIGTGLPGSEPTWSPDGSRLAFARLNQGSTSIMAAHTDGTNVVYITGGDEPAWLPHP